MFLKLMASLGLDSKEYEDGLDNAVDNANRSGSKIGKALIEGGKLAVKGMVAAAGAAATVTTMGVKSYATYEQLTGGVEKLFGKSAGLVMGYADEAYKSAGMSANEYMETVTSFSASLISGLGGDTAKAAEVADVAIRAMSDNANTFGTDMESVKNAIMGFSKGNFTMLDNLKLGFAGSQQGMIDLINASGILEDEIKDLDGVTFDQMIMAVQKVQENLGVAGTTAKEAASTIEGSFNTMKGAWSNLLNAMADPDQAIGPAIEKLVESVKSFGDNAIPRFRETMEGLGQAVDALAPIIADELPQIFESFVPSLVSSAFKLISAFGGALVSNVPTLINYVVTTATSVISSFSQGLTEGIPMMLSEGLDLALNFVKGLRENVGLLIDAGVELIEGLVSGFSEGHSLMMEYGSAILENLAGIILDNLPKLMQAGAEIINGLADGLVNGIPNFINTALPLILSFAETLKANAPSLIDAGINLISNLVMGLVNSIPSLIEYVPTIVETFANIINENAPRVLMAGWELLKNVVSGIINAIPVLIANIPQIFNAFVAAWNALNWVNLGKNAVTFVQKGLKKLPSAAKDIVKKAVNWIKSTFSGGGIESVVSGIFGKVKSVMTAPIDGAVNMIKGLVQTITNPFQTTFSKVTGIVKTAVGYLKSAFNFSWHLPHLSLPHISVSGGEAPFGIGGKGSLPKFSIQWYAKAMQDGVIFDHPTVLPTAQGMKGFGEAGAEMVIGRDSMMKMISEASTAGWQAVADILKDINKTINYTSSQLYNIIVKALHEMKVEFDERELARLVKKYA